MTLEVALRSRMLSLALLLPLALGASCFQGEGPEDPSPIPAPALVSIRIEYRQPNGCLNTGSPCDGPVLFFASWLPPGAYVALAQSPGTFIWTGTAPGVPVNFPPSDAPHAVRVGDPYLRDYRTGGATASRLRIGGQILTRFQDFDTPDERALVFIDAQGVGHNPF